VNERATKPLAGLGVSLLAVLLVLLLSVAGSAGGLLLPIGLPVFAACALLALALNWLAFVPAFMRQSERPFDLVGAVTYLAVVWLAASQRGDSRSLLLAGLISLWALRLGSFLFLRIRAAGGDSRFDPIKPYFFRFLQLWTLQGLWVVATAGAALAAMTSSTAVPPGNIAFAGAALWLIGFLLEVIADWQKSRHHRDPDKRGQFICSGPWSWSRHPNYFGEILLWFGIALIAAPALEGPQLLTLVSPLFVYLLLVRVSGIPPLERNARKRWGDDPRYQAYLRNTSRLLPLPPRRQRP